MANPEKLREVFVYRGYKDRVFKTKVEQELRKVIPGQITIKWLYEVHRPELIEQKIKQLEQLTHQERQAQLHIIHISAFMDDAKINPYIEQLTKLSQLTHVVFWSGEMFVWDDPRITIARKLQEQNLPLAITQPTYGNWTEDIANLVKAVKSLFNHPLE